MKTKEKIVLETLQAYADPANRAIIQKDDGPVCLYRNDSANPPTHCAVGRCMTEEALNRASNIVESFYSLPDQLGFTHHDELLRPEYRGHEPNFWITLQTLHDNNRYWTPHPDFPDNHLHLRYQWLNLHFPAALPRALELNLVKKP
jgi:hypothetical protein